ncbi:MAG: type IV secretory system conjugative DNA transfer family protein [Flavipsychrobacter sp.]
MKKEKKFDKINPCKLPAAFRCFSRTVGITKTVFCLPQKIFSVMKSPKHWFDVSALELQLLLERRPNPEARNKVILVLVSAFLTPITLTGSLLGYVRSYYRFEHFKGIYPKFHPMPPITRVAMFIGAALAWLVLIGLFFLLYTFVPVQYWTVLFWYLVINLFVGVFVYAMFRKWRNGVTDSLIQGEKFGTARFARADELVTYKTSKGFYIGGGHSFNDKGHILTVAGTRGGKGTNLIIPNLLGASDYQGSWVVIDPKGENAAISARYQAQSQNVVILNPWSLLEENLGTAQSYNPLDILSDTSNINLVDDAQMIAEMIIPIERNDRNKFFTDNARSIVTGLLLHMATNKDDDGKLVNPRSLKTLWEWVRLPEDKWIDLIADMSVNDHDMFGATVLQSANEIGKLMKAGEKTWGSVIATVLQCTDFIKSPALQKAMKSGFDPKTLSDGKTTLYVIIPADKLQSHARWLRLVVTTTMRAVVRKPNKRVCFLLDEFAALGYLPEIETALSTYAGFEITVWPILQSLIQLKANYSDNWETFVGNSTIRQFFSVNDNFTAEYVSKAIGNTSNVVSKRSTFLIEKSEANSRPLVTSDELRRASGQAIFAFIADRPVTYYPKQPYYEMPEIAARADDNPYFKS